ncbi:heavy-metal-associated domain-containing protein [Spirosoma taeanense]|uniref:Heavy-metal-associated domain-containing protein n=1 Tax=Spirosoma taeanense TaxID=2735870 RepID=A0A6M5Y662_9BACT|nr:heavy-metal-associated domain-containing protein [Spirosoma taeanense]QJW89917.1 heavy-metal-associated domain-containing protein [Spirosoma taeanense]
METLNFKTNIKCSNCVATVTPYLNDIEQVDGWNVNTDSPDKLLTVQTTDNRIADVVKQAVEKAGYKAELVNA